MSFARLYERVQTQGERISTRWLTAQAIELSTINKIKEQWSSVLDAASIRGFYVEGPLGPPVPLKDNEALIVLSRAMCTGLLGDYWRRFVYTKELMHVFDTDEEKTNTPAQFDVQIEKFGNPLLPMSPQYMAELKAFWRAIFSLCTKDKREELKARLESEQISVDVAATVLQIPPGYMPELMRTDIMDIFPGLV